MKFSVFRVWVVPLVTSRRSGITGKNYKRDERNLDIQQVLEPAISAVQFVACLGNCDCKDPEDLNRPGITSMPLSTLHCSSLWGVRKLVR